MIWTVVLKNGDGFVVHGSSFDRGSEVRKFLKGRNLKEDAVAGIVPGNHKVEPLNAAMPVADREDYSEQIKSALAAPDLDDDFTDRVMDDILSVRTDRSPRDEDGRPFNDPAKW
jgi:hypothetical protein